MSIKEAGAYGAFALVSYVPAPWGAMVDRLRNTLPGENHPESHITIVPPRPLSVSLDEAVRFTEGILEQFPLFKVVLGKVRCFPETRVLYLDLAQGEDEVHRLHDALNTGALAHKERFEFRPHLTIGGPLPEEEIGDFSQQVSAAWATQREERGFPVSEIVGLWYEDATEPREWTRVWSMRLRAGELSKASAAPGEQAR